MSDVRLALASVILTSWLTSWLFVGTVGAGELIEFANVSEHSRPFLLRGYLARPDGQGPFPAVVVLQRDLWRINGAR